MSVFAHAHRINLFVLSNDLLFDLLLKTHCGYLSVYNIYFYLAFGRFMMFLQICAFCLFPYVHICYDQPRFFKPIILPSLRIMCISELDQL